MSSRDAPLTRPFLSLFLIFSAWKTLLFIVAVLTPGLGYDTSTDLLFHHDDAQLGAGLSANDWKSRILGHILNRLVRWDAIYFASVAHRGYRHEQEWAFGWGFTSLISFVTKCMRVAQPAIAVQDDQADTHSLVWQQCRPVGPRVGRSAFSYGLTPRLSPAPSSTRPTLLPTSQRHQCSHRIHSLTPAHHRPRRPLSLRALRRKPLRIAQLQRHACIPKRHALALLAIQDADAAT